MQHSNQQTEALYAGLLRHPRVKPLTHRTPPSTSVLPSMATTPLLRMKNASCVYKTRISRPCGLRPRRECTSIGLWWFFRVLTLPSFMLLSELRPADYQEQVRDALRMGGVDGYSCCFEKADHDETQPLSSHQSFKFIFSSHASVQK